MPWKTISDDEVQAAKEAMFDSGQAPAGRRNQPGITSGVSKLSSEEFEGILFYDNSSLMWTLKGVIKETGQTVNASSPSRDELLQGFAVLRGRTEAEAHEEDARLTAEEARAEDPYEQALHDFMNQYQPHGQELETAVNGLIASEARHLGRMIYSCLGGLGLPVSEPENIYVAYVRLIDNNSEFAALIDKGLEQAAANEAAANETAATQQASDDEVAAQEAQARAEEEAFTNDQNARHEAEDLYAKRKLLSLSDLKALAYQEQHAAERLTTTPSRGLVKRGN